MIYIGYVNNRSCHLFKWSCLLLGTPASVASSSEFKSLFGSHAASRLSFYEHNHDHEHLPDGRIEHKNHSSNSERHILMDNVINEKL